MKSSVFIVIIVFFGYLSFAQLNISPVGNLAYPKYLSDIWGYEKTNGDELALVTTVNGFSVVDISTPSAPTEIFYKTSSKPDTWWRDVKTWDKYAYVVTEANEGLYIVDLEALPGTVTDKYYTGSTYPFTKAHNICIDENGIAYIFGANYSSGGVIILDLATDPFNPIELGVFDTYYVHDGVVRGDTLWASCINNGFQAIVDVSVKSSPVLKATWYTPNNFSHNCALSDNGEVLFTTDEKEGAYITSYNVTNIDNAIELDRWQSNPGSNVIPHNAYFMNDYIITSYYNDGVTICDVSKPDCMVETGFYDTEPAYSGDGNTGDPNDAYWGAWGAYPWLPSGNIIVSDGKTGLHILAPTYTRASFVAGNVTDSCGNSITGVTVTLLVNGTTKNNKNDGSYTLGIANSGVFDVQFSKTGYETVTVQNISLTNGLTETLDAMMATTGFVKLSAAVQNNIINCENVTEIVASNGDGNYQYLWDNAATKAVVNGLVAGNHSVTITDGLGCNVVQNITLTQPFISISISSTTVSCGASDGTAAISVISGTSPYSYLWSNAQTTVALSGLSVANYSTTVVDAVGCMVVDDVILMGDAVFTITTNFVTTVTCFGGSNGAIDVSASGSTSGYSFSWNNGIPFVGTTYSISGLSAGVQVVEVTDENQCVAVEYITIEDGSEIITTVTSTNPSCNGISNGEITVNVTGSNTPFSYLWNNGSTINTISGINAGDYCLSITNAVGCEKVQCTSLTDYSLFESTIYLSDSVVCDGQQAELEIIPNGGAIPYPITPTDAITWTGNWTGVGPGEGYGPHFVLPEASSVNDYNYTLYDANGCVQQGKITVLVRSELKVVTANADTMCKDVGASLVASGYGGIAVDDYVFSWSFDSVEQSVVTSNFIYIATVNEQISVTLNDGCSLADTAYIDIQIADSIECLSAVNELHKDLITLFPTPFSSTLSIETTFSDYSNVKIQLLDLTGRVLFEQQIRSANLRLDIPSSLSSGMYFIALRQNGKLVALEKILKK